MTLLRGFADDVTLGDWLTKYIWPAESRWIDEEYIEDGTKARVLDLHVCCKCRSTCRHANGPILLQLAVAEMLRCGVTCYNDMYFFPNVTARVSSEYDPIVVPLRAFLCKGLTDVGNYWLTSVMG